MSSNLPPGVTDSMIPGNRPEDVRYERMADRLAEVMGGEPGDPIDHEKFDQLVDFVIAREDEAIREGQTLGEQSEIEEEDMFWTEGYETRIKFAALPDSVQSDLRDRYRENNEDFEGEDEALNILLEERYRGMAPRDVLDEYLEWNGVIGYTGDFLRAVQGIRRAGRL